MKMGNSRPVRGNWNPLRKFWNNRLLPFPWNNRGFAGEPGDDKFYSGWSEEMKGHPSIQKFENAEALGKSYVELEKKIGAKGVLLPGKDAKPEEVAKFYNALGRPEKADGYAFTDIDGLDDRLKPSAEDKKAFMEAAHAAGLSQAQAERVRKWYYETQQARLKTFDDEATNEFNAAKTKLNQEWGAKYKENEALANRVLNQFLDKDSASRLTEKMGNDPGLIKLLANVGSKLSEDTLGGKGGGPVLSVEEARGKINEIYANPNHPYHRAGDPLHDEAFTEMTSLYKQAYPSGGGQ